VNDRSNFDLETWTEVLFQNFRYQFWTGIETSWRSQSQRLDNFVIGSSNYDFLSFGNYITREDYSRYTRKNVMSVYLKMAHTTTSTSFVKYQLVDCLNYVGATIAVAYFVGKCISVFFTFRGSFYSSEEYYEKDTKTLIETQNL